jgi:UDP-N-acetyl-D-mannosaminuronic acid dehydrogenase
VDPWFIVSRAPELAKLIRTAREVNESKPSWVIDKVRRSADKFKRPVIGCLGLAFKADVDDLRESPAVSIVRKLTEEGLGEILVAEPNLDRHAEFNLKSYGEVVAASDIVLLLVDHKEFHDLKASDFKEKILIDTRGIIV